MASSSTGSPSPLLDFSAPFDVGLLDATITAFYRPRTNDERVAAERVLNELQEHPDAWTRADVILESSNNPDAKFFALQIMGSTIKYKWNGLAPDQREGIKNFVSTLVVRLSMDDTVMQEQRAFVNKLNQILVQVVKQEWPHRWTSFIPDLLGASKTSESLCENCMVILKLLSEEVFDFSKEDMTRQKTNDLKDALSREYGHIHELVSLVLSGPAPRVSLVQATLMAIKCYLSWIPLGFIFEGQLIPQLLVCFERPVYRNIALECLTEIASLHVDTQYDSLFCELYVGVMSRIAREFPLPDTDFCKIHADGDSWAEHFVNDLALFLTTFFRHHGESLETSQGRDPLISGLNYLIQISYVEDIEVYKVCLDYWHWLVATVYHAGLPGPARLPPGLNGASGDAYSNPYIYKPAPGPGQAGWVPGGRGDEGRRKRELYAPVFVEVRVLAVSRMAKPEEVIVVEDEDGNIIRETMKDSDVLVQYKIMREMLIYLCNLDNQNTESIMERKLALQLDGKEWSWTKLSRLCWAIGSISGAMESDQENRFLVLVIRQLLELCEKTKGKDNKAVIASNIMYVVGQYPRFLKEHWKFLKTVVNKLFEFMHESHPGVQDMACDTFLKICQKCKKKFVIPQAGETDEYVNYILNELTFLIQDLEKHQVHVFYEAVGCMISAERNLERCHHYVARLMDPPNADWALIIAQAMRNAEVLKDEVTIRRIANIVRTNIFACRSLGTSFGPQIRKIFPDILNIYRMYSELVTMHIRTGGPNAAKFTVVKALRSVKKECLTLIETFVSETDDMDMVANDLLPPLMESILQDYNQSAADARDAEVLSLFGTIIDHVGRVESLQQQILSQVTRIFEAVFECTLQMITVNYEDYPDHRLKFFSLLRAVNGRCFQALISLSGPQLKLVVDSVVWALRHTERNAADTGLNILTEMISKFSEYGGAVAVGFFQAYYVSILQEIFSVLTDTFHKPGFRLHCRILEQLVLVASSPRIVAQPLWEGQPLRAGAGPFSSNSEYVKDHILHLLAESFPNMGHQVLAEFVQRMFDVGNHGAGAEGGASQPDSGELKTVIRDFLVHTKEFSAGDNSQFYAEEHEAVDAARRASVPGMVKDQ